MDRVINTIYVIICFFFMITVIIRTMNNGGHMELPAVILASAALVSFGIFLRR